MEKLIAANSFNAWILASRPKTLGAICCPMLLGSSLARAHGTFSSAFFLVALIAAILLQIFANVINDYGDFIKGSDTPERLGPPRAMQMGLLTKTAMHKGMLVIFILSIAAGLPLVVHAGWPVLIAGISGLLLCFFYTLGRRPLAYRGFVEIIIFFVFGPCAVLLAYFVQTLSFSLDAFFVSISPGFLATALILTNNLRDLEQDRKHQKLTIAVRCGETFARCGIIALILLSFLGPIILVLFFDYSSIVLCSLAALIGPLRHAKMILKEPISRKFNFMLQSIGKALYLFGMILSFGIIYGAP